MRVATEQIDEVPAIAPQDRSPRLGGTDVFRGSLVILTALIIGGFILSRGLDADTGVDDGDVAAETEADATGSDGTGSEETGQDGSDLGGTVGSTVAGEATTVTPEPTVAAEAAPADPGVEEPASSAPAEVVPEGPILRAPAEVKVLVLNGAQTQGIAARGTEALQAASYLTGAPKNATSQRPSAVLYAEGYQAEGLAVAAVFGPGLETLVQPLDPANLPIDDIQASHVIVVIGADQLIPIS